jgi:dienelactone hydrolase
MTAALREVPRKLIVAIAIAVALVLIAPRLAPVRTAVLTAALVPEMVGLGVAPVSATTDKPTMRTMTYGAPGDRMDVYLPAGAQPGDQLPAVVLGLGVHPQPIDSPEIVGLAEAIARLGVVVGVPDSAALRNLEVTPDEPGHLADAVLALGALPEVNSADVGLAGFSAGASIALTAAADPRLIDRLRWVSAFGAYADAKRLLIDVASRTTVDEQGMVTDWQPDAGIRRDVLALAINALDDDATEAQLHALLDPIVSSDDRLPMPAHDVTFTGDAAALYRLFTATDRTAAEVAVAELGTDLTARLDGISPLPVVDAIDVPVFLLHGRPDTAIPVAHAETLRRAIGDDVVRTTVFGRFGHGQPGSDGLSIDDTTDIIELSLFLRDIVAAATE